MQTIIRLGATVVAGVMLTATLSACSDAGKETPSPLPTTPSPQSSAPPSLPVSPATSEQPGLTLPANAQILVPPMTGNANAELPRFSHTAPEYTIYLTCTGGGSLTIRMNSRKPNTWPCDGVPNRHIVIADDPTEAGIVTVTGRSEWQVAVINGTP